MWLCSTIQQRPNTYKISSRIRICHIRKTKSLENKIWLIQNNWVYYKSKSQASDQVMLTLDCLSNIHNCIYVST